MEEQETDIFEKGLHRIKDFEATVTKLLEIFDASVVVYEGMIYLTFIVFDVSLIT